MDIVTDADVQPYAKHMALRSLNGVVLAVPKGRKTWSHVDGAGRVARRWGATDQEIEIAKTAPKRLCASLWRVL